MRPGEEEIVELVNVVIDGEATPAQEAELEDLLRTSPETRALFEAMREVAWRIEAVGLQDPPADLKGEILSSVAAAPGRRPATGAGAATRRRIYFALGWAAAAAFVLAVVLFHRTDTPNTEAAMMAPVVASCQSGVVRRHGDFFIVEPVISTAPATVSLDWDPEKLTLIGISNGSDAHFGKAHLSFDLRGPSQRAGVMFRPRPGAGATEVRFSVNQLFACRFVLQLTK